MKDKNQNCSNCYFFYQTSERGEAESPLHQQIGYCRANPPQPHSEWDCEGNLITKIGRFPVVLGHMWCGMWDCKDSK